VQGAETPVELVAKFRAHYLYSGNASESARKVGIDERTGRDIARRLLNDEDFAEDRRLLRATALEELVAARMRVMRKSLARFLNKAEMPDVVGENANVTIIDKRPDYGKLVLEAEKNAHNLARFDAEKSGDLPPEGGVTINVIGPADVEPTRDPTPA
jgi:phage terminase small subunit